MKARGVFFLSFLLGVFSYSLTVQSQAAEFYGSTPTGLLELERKYPYYLFVPPEYSPEKGWPLVVLLGGTSQEAREVVEEWLDWAKKNQVLLLVGTVYPREGTVPREVDRWWIRIKQEVTDRYRVVHSQVLLVGVEFGAQYAAYLGLRYPEEFSAAALFRRAWPGPMEKLMKPTDDPKKQIPFYVAVDPGGESFQAVEKKAAELEQKGYSILMDPLRTTEVLSVHRERLIQWFLQNTDVRPPTPGEKSRGGLKKTLREMGKNIFGN